MERQIFADQNELLYMALYNRQGESLESYTAKRSVISGSDIAYEWYKSLDRFETSENEKYLGILIESNEVTEKYVVKQQIVKYVEGLNSYRHQINTLKKHLIKVVKG